MHAAETGAATALVLTDQARPGPSRWQPFVDAFTHLDQARQIHEEHYSFVAVALGIAPEEWPTTVAERLHLLATTVYRANLEAAGWDVDLMPTPQPRPIEATPTKPLLTRAVTTAPTEHAATSDTLTTRTTGRHRTDTPTPGTQVTNSGHSPHTAAVVVAPDTDGNATVAAPEGHPLRSTLRSVPGARWDGTNSTWIIPVARQSALALRKALTGHRMRIDRDLAARLKDAADSPAIADVIVIDDRIEIRFLHTPTLQDDVKRLAKATWDGDRQCWTTPLGNAAGALAFADTHKLLATADVVEAAEKRHAPFDYDGTIDGLRGVPIAELHAVKSVPARGKTASLEDRLKAFGIESIYDLLNTVPFRYQDRSSTQKIRDLTVGEESGFLARVSRVGKYDRAKRFVRITVTDGTADVTVTFFNAPWMAFRFTVGAEVVVYGRLDVWAGNGRRNLQMTNPIMDPVGDDTAMIVPVYPQSEKSKVTTWDLHSAAMEAVRRLGSLQDPFPEDLKTEHDLIDRAEAYRQVHNPDSLDIAAKARTRLAFDELFRMQVALGMRRHAVADETGVRHQPTGALTGKYIDALPYTLTGAQQRALTEIKDDLLRPYPMHRLLQGDVGSGKAQPLTAGVLTPSGFRPMGDMRVGDEVVNPTGEVATVLGVYPQGEREVFRVHFSDGTSVRADGEHLWSVRTSVMRHRCREPRTMTTLEIANDLTERNGASKWHVEIATPVDLEDGQPLPIDPYLLGALIGDGSLSQGYPSLTSGDVEMIDLLREVLPPDLVLSTREAKPGIWTIWAKSKPLEPLDEWIDPEDSDLICDLYRRGYRAQTLARAVGRTRPFIEKRLDDAGIARHPKGTNQNSLVDALRRLDLLGKTSHDKFVPSAYLNASVKDRLSLLQGLLDTDGTLDYRTGVDITFSTVSGQLAEDVAWLARSLGGRASVRPKRRKSGDSWHVAMTLPTDMPPFRLRRKAMWVSIREKYAFPGRAITKIEADGVEPVQCIRVSHPNHLYVTDNFTPTHNTQVALVSLLYALEGGFQGALMAPTEILATQLFSELAGLLVDMTHEDGRPLVVEFLASKTRAKEKRRILSGLADGTVDIVVGTHALLTDDVTFANLGLVVIDEQHRFGVEQRAALRAKGPGGSPDMLLMTATPIPRTQAFAVYGDLSMSVLDELPPGRTPIQTQWLSGELDLDVLTGQPWDLVRAEVEAGRQAYVVASLVEDNEKIAAQSAEAALEALAHGPLNGLRLGMVHGKQPRDERETTMGEFKDGNIDVLVATTVIEVGVNVPNATVMVILDATRFGIAQLHQIRGRVGRGKHASHCILTGKAGSQDAVLRMEALVESTDGFYLSEVDLNLRGEGSIFGARQSGQSDLRVASLKEDRDLLVVCRNAAERFLDGDPKLLRRPGIRNEVKSEIGADAEEWLTRS